MGGSTTISSTETKLEAVKLQSSTLGATLPVVFGVTRVPGNMLWYGGFKATKHTKKQRAGKGGGVTSKTITYTYSAHVAMGICEGPILGIPRVWKGKEQFTGGIPVAQILSATESYTVPGGGGSKTLTNAATWRCTVAVYYTGTIDVGDGTTSGPIYLAEGTDYTVAAGVYTFGAAWAGKALSIVYQYVTGSTAQAGLAELGLTMFDGRVGQATWSLLSSQFTAQAIPYSGITYVAAQDYPLSEDAGIPNHNFELQGKYAYHLSVAAPDADPAMVTLSMLTDARYGALFPAERLNISLWSAYCRSASLLMSPAFTEQLSAAELAKRMAQLTNTAPVWSAGALKFIPFGDQALSNYGSTYTPNVTPLYDLTDDNFLPGSGGGEPVSVTPRPTRDAKNHIRVEFLDRGQDYNVSIAEAKDQADIDVNGLRSADVLKAHWICDKVIATKVAQLLLQRSLYVRNEYAFKLPWTYALLEPMDLVTLTESYLGLAQFPVRIVEIEEAEDGELAVRAEEFPAGVATASLYGSQGASGFKADYNAAPGNVSAPVIFEAPAELTTTGLEVYAAVTGTDPNWGGCGVWVSLDGVSYYQAGISFGARYGRLTGAIAGGDLPILLIADEVVSASAADAAALTSLCYIGGANPEYLSHTDVALTGALAYTLSGLYRSAYGTTATAHATNDPFVRVDDAVGKSGPLSLDMVGKTIYFKFTSFNIYGNAEQALADVSAYSYTITGYMAARDTGARLVTLAASAPTFTFDANGEPSPAAQTITLTATRQNTVGAAVWTTTPTVTLGGSGDVRTLSVANFGANQSVKIRATADGLFDEVTLVRLSAGSRNLTPPDTLTTPVADPMGGWDAFAGSVANSAVLNTEVGPYGDYPLILRVAGNGTGLNWYTAWRHFFSVDPTKAYVSYLWVRKRTAASALLYVGWTQTTGIEDLAGATAANPYSLNGLSAQLTAGKWYLAVSVIHPDGYVAGDTGLAGLYDPDTGLRTYDGTEYQHAAGVTEQFIRFGFYNATTIQGTADGFDFLPAGTYLMDGSHPTKDAILNARPNGIVGYLTNEAHTLPASPAGAVTSYAGATGTFKVFDGFADKTGSGGGVTYSTFANATGLTRGGSTTAIIDANGVYTIDGGMPNGTDTATVTLRATYKGLTIDKVLTISKSKAGADGNPGEPGTPGLNTARVMVYQRGTSAPAVPSADVTYTFATGAIAGLTNGWSASIPAGTDPLYVTAATAVSASATDTIGTAEWAAPAIMTQDGVKNATVYLFQRTATSTPPSLPSVAVTYTFASGVATGMNNGWAQSLPTTGGAYRWVTTAAALGTGLTDSIAAGEWAAAALLSQDGADGLSVSLSLPSFSVACDAAGTPKSGAFTGAVGQVKVYAGSTDVTAGATYSSATGGTCTGSVNTALNTPVSGAKGSYRVTAIAGSTGYLEITVTYGGKTAVLRFTLSKSIDGSAGSSAIDGTFNSITYNAYPTTTESGEIGGVLSLAVGPNGTISTSFYCDPWRNSAGNVYMKVQYRDPTAGSTWTDFPSASASGGTQWVVEAYETIPVVCDTKTMSGPTTPKVYQFRLLGYTNSGSYTSVPGSFYVAWGA